MPHKDALDSAPAAKSVLKSGFEAPSRPEASRPGTPISSLYETQRQIEQAPIAFDDEDSILEIDLGRTPDAHGPDPTPEPKPITTAADAIAVPPENREPQNELPHKPAAKLVKPSDIPSGTAEIGDRSAKPAGRAAVSWENPRALVGETVKGRYLIIDLVGDDEDSLEFLAEDRINEGKRAAIRVFMDNEAFEQHFAEERVSLAHLNHPNIAGVLDSGELPEGFRFVVSEFVDGESLAAALRAAGQFNARRAARIVRQVSYALSEAHENGILHRNLKPDNVMLTVSEAGIELVKLVNFELSNSFWSESDLVYKSPEEVVGDAPTFASEIWSLAVIAYEMLTARLPFNALSETELLRSQEKGLTVPPSAIRIDAPPLADKILEKALSVDPAERYPKARDFGDAFFNALAAVAPWETPASEPASESFASESGAERPREFFVVPPINQPATDLEAADELPVNPDIHIAPAYESLDADDADGAAVNSDVSWPRRSPEPPLTANWVWGLLPVVGAVVLLIALWGVWKFLAARPADVPAVDTQTEKPIAIPSQEPILPPAAEVDRPPEARRLAPVPDATRFVNKQDDLKGDLARNFLGFEVYYPEQMKRSESTTNFLDIAARNDEGLPLEQMLVTYYASRGTMTLDRPNFRKLADGSNAKLRELIGESYRVISDGETAIQNGRWKGFEVKFEGSLPDGETRLFGRRIWIPVQSPGVQRGFVITLIATSLAPEIRTVDDVGTKGLLAAVVENFEPEPRY